ncbi:NADH dehydrogenase subunit B /NADH dehydrogenase subunit C [Archaeoglobus sulfaticallidus PM70-1]|uniref:NADH dehydrogenase subunit B /NADH dehydrogenase subunit C n=1 Tax=Archaeoglobus sulfaticallidus PM70-1 TaxID=387631 RepID=N0BM75_9EURY|nr:NADH-quinone oxidoreductase subunit NuoB [Archaeoglobus sulfaticallidus]AGK61716.1 NADH dehydrogenase subunit B /NADH dehydrogenase subunit C [Archaeoglobus sulfaticallidus PM70-1]
MSNTSQDFSGPLGLIKKWGTKWSLWPVHLVTACCGVELAHAYASGYDGERLGSLNYGISRQTNLIIVEGAISRKMARVLKITYEQMPDPKFVIVMGACGLKGGLFWNGYHMVRPSDVVPVDFFIPGCPPTPESLLRAIRELQEKIMKGESRNTIEFERCDISAEGRSCRALAPSSPKYLAPTPSIAVDVPKEVEWEFGAKLVEELRSELDGLYDQITITGKNRIAIRTCRRRISAIASKLCSKFDHVKNVNVIDLPHENSFIVEYQVSSYSVRDLMPVVVNIFARIPRDNPRFPSLRSFWESADYMEREMHEFFGVWFEGNPAMGERFLLAPDTPDYPLRKDRKVVEERYVEG